MPKIELMTKRIYRVDVRVYPRLMITFETEDQASQFVKGVGNDIQKFLEELNKILVGRVK